MALIDHFQGPDNPNPIEPVLPVHQFSAAIYLWKRGRGSRATMVSRMGLNDTAGNDKEQLDVLDAIFDALPVDQKAIFRNDLEAGLELYEYGWIETKAELRTVLGL